MTVEIVTALTLLTSICTLIGWAAKLSNSVQTMRLSAAERTLRIQSLEARLERAEVWIKNKEGKDYEVHIFLANELGFPRGANAKKNHI